MKKQPKIEYPYINKLNIPIHIENNGIPHLLVADIKKALTKKQFELFHEYFGIQTCLCRKDGKSGLYVWDCESVFVRMFENRLIGSQKDWD